MISNYKAIIFDWDGTLVDTCGLVLNAHNHVRSHYGHKLWTMEDFLGQASQSAREYYPTIYGENAEQAQKILYQYVETHHLTTLKPMNGAIDLLQSLQHEKIPMGILSNKRHNTLNIEVDYMQWRDYFMAVIGAGKAEKDKPSVAPLKMTLQLMDSDLKPTDILYIGDTETDLICAKNAQCDVVLVQSEKPRPDLIEKYNVKHSCFNLNELKTMLLEANEDINRAC